jgi:hypothetical protein
VVLTAVLLKLMLSGTLDGIDLKKVNASKDGSAVTIRAPTVSLLGLISPADESNTRDLEIWVFTDRHCITSKKA